MIVPATQPAAADHCARCGAAFICAANQPANGEPCWCTGYPPLARLPKDLPATCLCETCLRQSIEAQGSATKPAEERTPRRS